MHMSALSRWVIAVSILCAGFSYADEKKPEADRKPPADKKADAEKKHEPTKEMLKPVNVATTDETLAKIESALSSYSEVQYLDTELTDVVNDLELRHRIDLSIDTEALTTVGKGADSTVTIQVRDVSLRSILNRVLKQHNLTWTVVDEGILITTPEENAKHLSTRVYSVADLGADEHATEYDELMHVITQSVDPESWREAGGPSGSIAKVSAKQSLVITQTYRNHYAIKKLLKQLAER